MFQSAISNKNTWATATNGLPHHNFYSSHFVTLSVEGVFTHTIAYDDTFENYPYFRLSAHGKVHYSGPASCPLSLYQLQASVCYTEHDISRNYDKIISDDYHCTL